MELPLDGVFPTSYRLRNDTCLLQNIRLLTFLNKAFLTQAAGHFLFFGETWFQREGIYPPVWGCAPGLGPPGKAMAEEVMVQDPGPRGEGRMPQGHERGGKRSYLPRGLRIRLFDEVNRLRRDGLTYLEIIGWIWRRYGVRLSKSHISYWLRGIHNPYNGRYIPSIELLRPSEELAYVIGVKVGDGYTYKRRRAVKGYSKVIIGLEVKERMFAVEFGRCLAKVLEGTP
jgi:hypothetical protein